MEIKSDPTVVWLVNPSSREQIKDCLPMFEQPCVCVRQHKYPWLSAYKVTLLLLLTCHLPLEICEYEIWSFFIHHPKCFESAQDLFGVLNPEWQMPMSSNGLKDMFETNWNIGIFSNAMDSLLPYMLYLFDPLVCVVQGNPGCELDMLPNCFFHADIYNKDDSTDCPAKTFALREQAIAVTHRKSNKFPPGWKGFDDLLIHGSGSFSNKQRASCFLRRSHNDRYKNWLLHPPSSLFDCLHYLIIYNCDRDQEDVIYRHCHQHLSREEFQALVSNKSSAHVISLRHRSGPRHWSFEVPCLLPPFRLNRGGMWDFVSEKPFREQHS